MTAAAELHCGCSQSDADRGREHRVGKQRRGNQTGHGGEHVPERVAEQGDPWEGMNDEPQSLEPLLALWERDRAAGLMDAPWPPVYPKQPDEPPRVAPSRARKDDR